MGCPSGSDTSIARWGFLRGGGTRRKWDGSIFFLASGAKMVAKGWRPRLFSLIERALLPSGLFFQTRGPGISALSLRRMQVILG